MSAVTAPLPSLDEPDALAQWATLSPPWLDAVRAGVLRVHLPYGGGSAFAWSAAAPGRSILTNHHVVARHEQVRVSNAQGETFAARVTARSPGLDLALLETDAELPSVPVADSRALRLGELVFAWGHPWGRAYTLTRGVVSGLGKVAFGGKEAEFVRSDVRLAPGNSGGPLLNAAGKVVGVNSMVWGGALGVAVPTHVALAWTEGLARPRPKLGVGVAPVQLARRAAVMVTAVEASGAADRSGLRVGDVLLAANGEALHGPDALRAALDAGGPALHTVRFDVWRAGSRLEVAVPLTREVRAA